MAGDELGRQTVLRREPQVSGARHIFLLQEASGLFDARQYGFGVRDQGAPVLGQENASTPLLEERGRRAQMLLTRDLEELCELVSFYSFNSIE